MALFFGQGIHSAMDVRYAASTMVCDQGIESRMIEVLADHYDGADCGDDYRNLDYAIETIRAYNKQWRVDVAQPIEVLDWDEKIDVPRELRKAVEIPVTLPLGTIEVEDLWVVDADKSPDPFLYTGVIHVVFTGRVDMVTKKKGSYFIFDHKTTSRDDSGFFDEFSVTMQMKGYKYAIQTLCDVPIVGCEINKLVCRPPKQNGDINFTFQRQEVYLDDSQIDEWRVSFMYLVQDIITCIQRQFFPLAGHSQNCKGRYGRCEFYEVCQLDPAERPFMLMSNIYEENTWDPIVGEKTKPKADNYEIAGLNL